MEEFVVAHKWTNILHIKKKTMTSAERKWKHRLIKKWEWIGVIKKVMTYVERKRKQWLIKKEKWTEVLPQKTKSMTYAEIMQKNASNKEIWLDWCSSSKDEIIVIYKKITKDAFNNEREVDWCSSYKYQWLTKNDFEIVVDMQKHLKI